MVCYCPLSVLSVPESILNEGQLHLAAIFQLSHRCHGDVVVFFAEPGCKQQGCWGVNGAGREGTALRSVGIAGQPLPTPHYYAEEADDRLCVLL